MSTTIKFARFEKNPSKVQENFDNTLFLEFNLIVVPTHQQLEQQLGESSRPIHRSSRNPDQSTFLDDI